MTIPNATLTQYQLPIPTDNMPFIDWFSQIPLNIPTFDVPRVDREEDWIVAAEMLMRNDDCVRFNCPWPASFSNWRDWARRFVAAFGGQG